MKEGEVVTTLHTPWMSAGLETLDGSASLSTGGLAQMSTFSGPALQPPAFHAPDSNAKSHRAGSTAYRAMAGSQGNQARRRPTRRGGDPVLPGSHMMVSAANTIERIRMCSCLCAVGDGKTVAPIFVL